MYKQVLKGMMICDICNFLSRYGLVHCNEQFWQPLQLLDFPRLVSYLSLWLCTVMLFISREIGWQMYTFWLTIYKLDTMACTWWDKRRGVWWYDICRNQEKHARGVWVCCKLVISLLFASCMQLICLKMFKHYSYFILFCCRSRNKDKLRYRYPRGESYLDVIQR